MQSISILLFNTEFQHNLDYGLFDNIILQRQPDIIALVEVDQAWVDHLSEVLKSYPYRQMSFAGAGMALYSKLPIEKVEVRYFGVSHHPRIFAVLKAGEKKINLLVVHPTTPKTETAFRERSTEMRLMSEEMNSVSAPKVLLGDMNCGPWSPAFATFAQNGLVDSERNFCLQPSWPARTGRVLDNVPIPPLIPIDHVLVSPDVCVLERRAGPAIESDHLPVFTRLAL
jgi:endonuclease/exonuclease/phosphatase (EEP) superfamily protein YafD